MYHDDPAVAEPLHHRLARLRSTLELCNVYLAIGTFTEADQQALQKRVSAALDFEEAQANRGPFS